MTAAWMTPLGVAYMGVFLLSGLACFAAVPRVRTFDDAELRYGLIGLLVTSGLWAVLKAVFFVVPDPLREPIYTIGLVFGFATVWAWLYFASAYSGRRLHMNRRLRQLSVGVVLAVVTIKLTNPIHELYFTTAEATTPFQHLAINHGVIHWASTGLAYVLAAVGLFMIFELFVASEYSTRALTGFTALLGLPVMLDIVAVAIPELIDFIYAPLGVAAFAIGAVFLFGEQLLTVQTTAQTGAATVVLDRNGQIREFSADARRAFPELEGAVGEKLDSVLPAVAATRDGDGGIVERNNETDRQSTYYFASFRSVPVGDSALTVLALADVTENERQRRRLVQRERELAQRNELYRAVMAASFAFIFRIDLDMKFSFVSPTVESFLGYTPAELTGEPISILASDQETFNEASRYIKDVTQGNSLEMRDHPVATRSGRTVYVDMRMVPIYEPSVELADRTPEDIVGLQVMVRDASERRQREGLISVINRVLRHNVRNKMTVIGGRAELLAAALEGDAKSNADAIVQASQQLLNLTESAQHIEANRELSPTLETIDLAPIITESVGQLEKQYPNVTVTAEIPETALAETLPRIETALWELLENAAVHTGAEPTVDVTVSSTDQQIRIAISDDGPGFPEDERQVLAEGKEEPLVHGQSLGLYLTYWIITTLEGEIDVPKSQSGTTVEIRLPAASSS